MIKLCIWRDGDQAGRELGVVAVISLDEFYKFCSDAFLFDSSRGSGRENSDNCHGKWVTAFTGHTR